MEIAVLGGGNGGFAAAADLALQGHAVRFWRRDAEAVARLEAEGGAIELIDGDGAHTARPALVTADLGAAASGAELIVVPAPAFAQDAIARALAPHLADGQVIFLPPGTFGSVLMAQLAREAGVRADVAFAETGTLPWLARKRGPHRVAVSVRATRLPTGVFPLDRQAHGLSTVARAFPAIEPCGDALSAALMNAGPVIHPPLILMNAGPLEHSDRWDIHAEGTQPSVRRVTTVLDGERMAVREALGYGPPHFPLADHYAAGGPGEGSGEGDEWMYGRRAHDRLVDSGDWREPVDLLSHRYMREDVALGLAFLVSVAGWAGVPVPVARGLLALGSAVAGEDFLATGRTLGRLGLDRVDRAGMTALLRHGWGS